ncbi:MAG: translation initiation factor IF-3, partial [Gammaproteobacteria bacterium]|nr:translation initiation factor IF-3 [Gammaproteobacteria bacterium]
ELVTRIREDLVEYGTVEQEPKMEGRQIVMVLAPVKKR